MTNLERILARAISADIIVLILWMLLGGTYSDAVAIMIGQVVILWMQEGVMDTIKALAREIKDNRAATRKARNARRRM